MNADQGFALVAPGDVVAGKYRIDRVLGAGGMGVVVAAHHLHLDEPVAIKFLLPRATGEAEAVARFVREARAAVKIKSEHVARVIDVGTLETGAPYIVMEYLEGADLSTWIRKHGPLAVEQVVDFVLQTCDAIADAHSQGIVHRDLKPANLFCTRRNDGQLCIKVLDFGISKTRSSAASGPDFGITKTAAVMGSPFYMSPEQLQSAKDADQRSDIWGLGVILYELLGGTVPFSGDTMAEVVLKITTQPPSSLCALQHDIPAELEAVVMKCLEKARADRYQNIADLASALRVFAPSRSLPTVERIGRVIQVSDHPASTAVLADIQLSDRAQTASSWGQTKPTPARRRSVAMAMVGLLLVAVAATAVTVLVAHREPSPTRRASSAVRSPVAAEVTASRTEPPRAAASSVLVVPVSSAPVPGPAPRLSPPSPVRLSAVRRKAPKAEPQHRPITHASCDPAYTIDAAGHRTYKPECLE